ncbi:secretory subunit [Chytridiales sp. JEL 0842]|nr:secretory subunit [Chytridiales sp. JEL 0842]
MGQYEYDETGNTFKYFLTAVLTITLIPYTLAAIASVFTPSKASKEKKDECTCNACLANAKKFSKVDKKSKSFISGRVILILFGWLLLGLLVHNIATTFVEEKGPWDPYQILDVDPSADKAEIKKRFKKLSLIYHPDKVQESEKEAAQAKFVEISKAYNVLTDEEARKIFDEFGHPDGKQSLTLGIALPKWLVETKNNFFVLFVYATVFGVGLPYWVAKWWYRGKNQSSDKISHGTMARFYRDLSDPDSITRKALLELVCKSEEILTAVRYEKTDAKPLKTLTDELISTMGAESAVFDLKKKITDLESATSHKALVLLLAHMSRMTVSDKHLAEQQAVVVEKAAHMMNGVLQIAAARFWLTVALIALDLRQAITQAVMGSSASGPFAQLPNIRPSIVKKFIVKKPPIKTIRDLVGASKADQDALLNELTPDEKNETLAVANKYPLLAVRKALFYVLGEPSITPSSIVTLHVKLELIDSKDLPNETNQILDVKPEEEEPKSQWFDKKEDGPVYIAHAPYFPSKKTPTWWVMLGDRAQNRLICLGKITDLGPAGTGPKSVRLQFQAPPKSGTWEFQVYVKCDSVIGCDAGMDVKMVVEEAPAYEEIEDDISEPDEDTIAGQMQAIRSGKIPGGDAGDAPVGAPKKKASKAKRDEYEDSSDSDDSDDE